MIMVAVGDGAEVEFHGETNPYAPEVGIISGPEMSWGGYPTVGCAQCGDEVGVVVRPHVIYSGIVLGSRCDQGN